MTIYPLTPSFDLPWVQIAKHRAIALLHCLTSEQGPVVHHCQTPTGHIWKVYDPHTQQIHQFTSEQEVRCWLEQRYYHS